MNDNQTEIKSSLSENERRNIHDIILDLESSHNEPSSYAHILQHAVIYIEPEGKTIEKKTTIEQYRKELANTKTYSEFTILKEILLAQDLILLTCSEILYRANFRGMQASSTKLYNIILQKKKGLWQIHIMQIIKSIK